MFVWMSTEKYGEVRRNTAGVVSFARNEGIKKRRSRRNGDAFSADLLLQTGFFALVVIVETQRKVSSHHQHISDIKPEHDLTETFASVGGEVSDDTGNITQNDQSHKNKALSCGIFHPDRFGDG